MSTLVQMKADIDGPFGAVARADAVRQVVTMKALIEMREQTNQLAVKDEEIQRLQLQIEVCKVIATVCISNFYS